MLAHRVGAGEVDTGGGRGEVGILEMVKGGVVWCSHTLSARGCATPDWGGGGPADAILEEEVRMTISSSCHCSSCTSLSLSLFHLKVIWAVQLSKLNPLKIILWFSAHL